MTDIERGESLVGVPAKSSEENQEGCQQPARKKHILRSVVIGEQGVPE